VDRMIAHCGMVCSDCEAYENRHTNDREAMERVAARWRVAFNRPDATADDVICDGCTAQGRHWVRCAECPIRACAAERGVANCAYCDDYDTCEKLTELIASIPEAKAMLDAIRASL
jgi:hypothetical protein